jgi:hypothetical protein
MVLWFMRNCDFLVWQPTSNETPLPGTRVTTVPLPIVLPMICTCDPVDLDKADEFLHETFTLLDTDPPDPGSQKAPNVWSENFLSTVVFDLEIYYCAHITKIYCDQWAAVVVQRRDGSIVSCECDRVEDGIAAIWRWFYTNETRQT